MPHLCAIFHDKRQGKGLGLSTVYGIVKRSGGYLLVSGEVGIGTAMQVYLPQVKSEANASTPEKKSSEESMEPAPLRS